MTENKTPWDAALPKVSGGRLLGLDYGSKTVGVAISDPLLITAGPLETITRPSENHLRRTLARICEIIGEYDIFAIILGYPKLLDNTAGERASLTEAFKARLEERTGLDVILWDERLSTAQAERQLLAQGLRRDGHKPVIDQAAAMIILQSYLDSPQGDRMRANGPVMEK